MDAFLSKKRPHDHSSLPQVQPNEVDEEEGSTEFKLALLSSLYPDITQDLLLDALLECEGSVEKASAILLSDLDQVPAKKQKTAGVGYQSSLNSLVKREGKDENPGLKSLTKKGKTLFLYSPEDIENHTPCSIIHNFLPTEDADTLLHELLGESPSFSKETFQLFDRTVESPHT